MKYTKSLPSGLINRYLGWRATEFAENKAWYVRLAENGQTPRTMVISCCDSRVHATSVFGAETGEFFMHRNIANLVPPYAPNNDYHGTSAALEYAISILGVTNIIVMGHSLCGGVKACHQMCSGKAPELEEASSFIGRWMDILRPAYKRLNKEGTSEEDQISDLEREGILVSLENLMSFPFISKKVKQEELALHGIWIDIKDGHMESYDSKQSKFLTL